LKCLNKEDEVVSSRNNMLGDFMPGDWNKALDVDTVDAWPWIGRRKEDAIVKKVIDGVTHGDTKWKNGGG
jgi:hypothetical protein